MPRKTVLVTTNKWMGKHDSFGFVSWFCLYHSVCTGIQDSCCLLVVNGIFAVCTIWCEVAGRGGSIRSTVVACWTAGQPVKLAILHQRHDSFITKFISLALVVPGPV